MKNKVVLIGCGNVGMSYAYSLLNQSTYVNELALIDLDENRIQGEVMDLNHCLAFAPHNIDIHVGKYEDCRDAKIVVIAAGANQKPGETRLDLIGKNASIFKNIVSQVMANGFDGIFLIATNPLDVMTYLTQKFSGLPRNRVFGTGTSLDTIRLQYNVGKTLKIHPKNVQAYVIGEHGDSEFIPWSNANIGLQNIRDFLRQEDMDRIEHDVRNAAYEIIEKKGATYYGIGIVLTRITNAILGDENMIFSLSVYDETNDVYIGLPAIVNKDGIRDKVYIRLTEEETSKLVNSINVIKDTINSLDL